MNKATRRLAGIQVPPHPSALVLPSSFARMVLGRMEDQFASGLTAQQKEMVATGIFGRVIPVIASEYLRQDVPIDVVID